MCRVLSSVLASLAILAAVAPAAASAEVFQVTTTTDGNGACLPGACTLRQAVNAANSSAGNNSIVVPTGHYTLSLGELRLQRSMTIEGAGAEATRIDANSLSRVFKVEPTVSAYVEDLAVEGGKVAGNSAAQAQGGGILNAGALTLIGATVRGNRVLPADNTGLIPEGAGIYNSGVLHVADSRIAGNETTTLPFAGGIASGAGIANHTGRLDVVDSTIADNTASAAAIPEGTGIYSVGGTPHGASVELVGVRIEGNQAIDPGSGGITGGGGIWVFATDLTLVESAVVGNSAKGGAIAEGAGIFFAREGDLSIERSLIAGNVAESNVVAEGAGLDASGETNEALRVVNSTIAGNQVSAPTSTSGGGLFHFGAAPLRVFSSTIAGNSVSGNAEAKGGDVFDYGGSGSATILRNSIVAGGSAVAGSENCGGEGVQSAGHNVDSLDQCHFAAAGDQTNANPLLGPLADNGGPTETLALGASSPAIDAGLDCPATDQRNVARPQGAACDVGAFELVPAPPKPAESAPAPVPPKPAPPALRLGAKAKIDLSSGKGKLSARCLAGPADSCRAKLALLVKAGRKTLRVGGVTGKIAGGKSGKLAVKLGHKGIELLAAQPAQRLAVTVSGSSSGAGGAVAVKAKLTLKGKAPVARK